MASKEKLKKHGRNIYFKDASIWDCLQSIADERHWSLNKVVEMALKEKYSKYMGCSDTPPPKEVFECEAEAIDNPLFSGSEVACNFMGHNEHSWVLRLQNRMGQQVHVLKNKGHDEFFSSLEEGSQVIFKVK